MNRGIADATVLVQDLTAAMAGLQSVEEAADAYQIKMISRAGEEVVLGVMDTEMLHD
jgi:hypothetical protein